ncbi:hypothetical protein GF356_01000 [candidate division GN15 bacterium]|nr:hypothetical protein [candidate division GN15 bacterium]
MPTSNSFPRLLLVVPMVLLIIVASSTSAQEQTVGLLKYDQSQSFNGYTLFEPRKNSEIFLIDNYGRLVHSWQMEFANSSDVYLLPSGKLLRGAKVTDSLDQINRTMQLIAWDGTVEWSFPYQGDTYRQHHDIEPMPNGNILLLASQNIGLTEATAMGFDPAQVGDAGVKVDYIAELQPVGTDSAIVVWEWYLLDHLIQDFDSTKPNYGVVAEHPELFDANWHLASYSDWTHCNSIAYNPQLDQIVLSSRNWGELWVIDHSTTTAEAAGHTGGNSGMGGDILYRWGNPQTYRAGTADDHILYGPHDIHWIEPGLPGEGNIMVYNNGWNRPEGSYSTIEEITSTVDQSGDYPQPDSGVAHGPADVTWSYGAHVPQTFFSATISGAHRLPNRNTIVCTGRPGYLFEVTNDGEVVWEYQNSVDGDGPIQQGAEPHQANMQVFRCHRYPLDYPAFDGRSLQPGAPIEDYIVTVSGTSHMPVEPSNSDSVLVTTRIVPDSDVTIVLTELIVDTESDSLTLPLLDDGTHGDGIAGDSVYGAYIPPLPGNTNVTYHVYIEEDKGNTVLDPVFATDNDVYYTYTVTAEFICGDINGDGNGPNVSDLTYLVDYLFSGGPQPPDLGTADVNGDGEGPNVSDLTYLVAFLFSGGSPLNCQ